MPDGTRFGLSNPAVVGSTVFGQVNTATTSGIARLDLSNGHVEKLVAFPQGVSGTASIVAAPPWLAWTLGNSPENIFDWTIYAKNLDSGETRTVAASRLPDGGFLPGQQPTLLLRGTTLMWSQALPGSLTQYRSSLHRYDLSARRDEILATGRVSAPVYAGELLIWAERGDDGVYSFRVNDARTLAPMDTPPALRDPSSIIYLGGNRRYFAWTAQGLLDVHVWRVGSNELRTYRAPDIKHYFQYLQFAGDYMLWYSGVTSAVLDLRTGAFVDIAGSLAAGDGLVVMERPVTEPTVKGEVPTSRVAAARASELPVLRCAR